MDQEKKSSFYRIWDVLQPFAIYYFLHFVIFYLLAFLFQVSLQLFGQGYADYMTAHAETVTGIASGAAMLLAVAPLLPMLKRELTDRKAPQEKTGNSSKSKATVTIITTMLLAVTSSVGLNILLSITGLVSASDAFQDVSRRQFGVAFGIGIVLYGIVSPLAEEIVFRGLLYHRMRKYFPVWLAIAVSGFFFGLYHGNLVQGIYGSCMGILMAYMYERTGRFYIPLLFHAAANISVYAISFVPELQDRLFQALNCVILLTISMICVAGIEKIRKF